MHIFYFWGFLWFLVSFCLFLEHFYNCQSFSTYIMESINCNNLLSYPSFSFFHFLSFSRGVSDYQRYPLKNLEDIVDFFYVSIEQFPSLSCRIILQVIFKEKLQLKIINFNRKNIFQAYRVNICTKPFLQVPT